MKVDKAPTETYADIGGLENQIRDIKVFLFNIGICRTSFDSSRII